MTRCAAARQATALDPSPRLAVQSTAAAAAFAELGMHLADTGSPVARFRAGLDNPRGLLKTRPGGKTTFGVSAELANDAKDVYIYLRDGYINAICPLSPALYACVPQPTIASLGVLYPPSGPSFDIGSQSASAALCVTMRAEDPHSHTHTTDESLKKEVGGGETVSVLKSEEAPGDRVSGIRLPIPGCVRGEPPELPACFPSCNGRF